jgi:RNA polymerase sigma-70 factor (ECF subfamily)
MSTTTSWATGVLGLLPGRGRRESLAELDEQALILRAGPGGDKTAFSELVRRHEARVRGLLTRLSGDRALADDLAQDVFLRAFRGLSAFEGRARISTWLYRIAYNVYLNHRSRTHDHGALPDGWESFDPERTVAPGTDLRKDLDAAISALPERYRSVIVLYYLEDVSYPEIAEVLNLPLGTVKTHLHRAKRMLREQLGEWSEPTQVI